MMIPLPFAVINFDAAAMWLLVGEMFVLGAALGSFFNVVAYRLPRRMSLVRPPSQCPACGRPIRWYDNVPIFGWLMLGGRCRNCRAAISPRYPVVELLVGVVTAGLCWSHFATVAGPEGVERHALEPWLLAFRLLLVYTLFCAALLELDAHRAPLRLLITVLISGAVLSTIWPELRPPAANVADVPAGLIATAWVLAAGALLGLVAWPVLVATRDGDAVRCGVARVTELALVGVFLGLAAVAATAVFALTLFVAGGVASRFFRPAARFGWAAWLVIATLIWIVGGAALVARWPGRLVDDASTTLVAAGASVAVLAIVGRLARGRLTRIRTASGEHD